MTSVTVSEDFDENGRPDWRVKQLREMTQGNIQYYFQYAHDQVVLGFSNFLDHFVINGGHVPYGMLKFSDIPSLVSVWHDDDFESIDFDINQDAVFEHARGSVPGLLESHDFHMDPVEAEQAAEMAIGIYKNTFLGAGRLCQFIDEHQSKSLTAHQRDNLNYLVIAASKAAKERYDFHKEHVGYRKPDILARDILLQALCETLCLNEQVGTDSDYYADVKKARDVYKKIKPAFAPKEPRQSSVTKPRTPDEEIPLTRELLLNDPDPVMSRAIEWIEQQQSNQ